MTEERFRYLQVHVSDGSVEAELLGEVQLQRALVREWRELAEARDRLLACYRVGTQKGAPTALGRIERARRQIERLEAYGAAGERAGDAGR